MQDVRAVQRVPRAQPLHKPLRGGRGHLPPHSGACGHRAAECDHGDVLTARETIGYSAQPRVPKRFDRSVHFDVRQWKAIRELLPWHLMPSVQERNGDVRRSAAREVAVLLLDVHAVQIRMRHVRFIQDDARPRHGAGRRPAAVHRVAPRGRYY